MPCQQMMVATSRARFHHASRSMTRMTLKGRRMGSEVILVGWETILWMTFQLSLTRWRLSFSWGSTGGKPFTKAIHTRLAPTDTLRCTIKSIEMKFKQVRFHLEHIFPYLNCFF